MEARPSRATQFDPELVRSTSLAYGNLWPGPEYQADAATEVIALKILEIAEQRGCFTSIWRSTGGNWLNRWKRWTASDVSRANRSLREASGASELLQLRVTPYCLPR